MGRPSCLLLGTSARLQAPCKREDPTTIILTEMRADDVAHVSCIAKSRVFDLLVARAKYFAHWQQSKPNVGPVPGSIAHSFLSATFDNGKLCRVDPRHCWLEVIGAWHHSMSRGAALPGTMRGEGGGGGSIPQQVLHLQPDPQRRWPALLPACPLAQPGC